MEHDRILGYFLEEASEHLNTIEQGLRKLPETVKQPQTIRELFRAAHSIKGSAAMLGLLDIQKIGNQFEANFKLLKEQPQIAVDKQLQSLFLESFGFLQAGIEEVRVSKDPYRQDPATPDPVGDPVFEELRSYLQHLLTTGDFRAEPLVTHSRDLDQNSAVEQVFGEYVTRKLDEIISLCLQPDQPVLRTQIQQICQKLGNLGENFEFLEWTNLLTACRLAIANPANTLSQLAESISIAIKQAQVLVRVDRHQEIRVTPDLEALIVGKTSKSTSLGSENLSTWQLTNPHDPVASVGTDLNQTTQRLDRTPTQLSGDASTQDLAKVEFSNIDTSYQLTDSISTAPKAMTADELELNEFMNLLGEDMSSEGTWIEDDNFFNSEISLSNLGESTTDQLQLQPLGSITSPKAIDLDFDLAQAIAEQQVGDDQYNEETFYNPDLEEIDDQAIDNFWSDTKLELAQHQPISPDLDLTASDQPLQPDLSPVMDLGDIIGPDFGLDLPTSDLFPTVNIDQLLEQNPAELAHQPTSTISLDQPIWDNLTDGMPFEFGEQLIDEPVAEVDFLSNITNSSSFDYLAVDTPALNYDISQLTDSFGSQFTDGFISANSDVLFLEELNPGKPPVTTSTTEPDLLKLTDLNSDQSITPATADDRLSNELTNWLDDNSLGATDFSEFDNLPGLDLDLFGDESAEPILESALTAPALIEPEPLVSIDNLDLFGGELVEPTLTESSIAINQNDRQFSAEDLSFDDSDKSDSTSSTDPSLLINSTLNPALADLEFDLDRGEFGNLELNTADFTNLDLDTGSALGDSFTDLDLDLFGSGELNAPQSIDLELSNLENSEDLSDLNLDIFDQNLDVLNGDRAVVASSISSDLTDFDLNDIKLDGINVDGIDQSPNSNFEDLSELNFDLDANSNDLLSADLTDLESMLESDPGSNLAANSDLDALLGNIVIGAGGTAIVAGGIAAFADLDVMLDPTPAASSAMGMEDLDSLLAVPVISTASIPSPQLAQPTLENRKTADRRSKQSRTFEQTMRVSVRHLDNLSNLVGELVVNRNTLEQDQNRMRQFVEKLLSEVQKLNEVGKRMQDLYERSLMENSLIASRQQSKVNTAAIPQSGGDDTSSDLEYDPLEMDRFTPIHLLSQKMIELTVRVRESTADIEFVVDGSTEVTRTLRQITGQLQEDLTKSRMIPFAQTADRLQRGVRDNGLKYGKQVELTVEGRDTLIDKVILESLTDPLIHMVNNAIAHGIETIAERQALGKPTEGKITIRALHQGNQTIISISDDGAGIDTDRVKQKAIEKGIITTAQAAVMSKTEAYDLLFLPSFSTKDEADELAGRGVGMDVVRTSITEIRGTISTESQLGIGTTFTIRLPLALSIAKALIAVNNKNNIAFPMDGIEDTQDVNPEQIQVNGDGKQCIFWRDEMIPFKPLSDLLGFNRPLPRNNVYTTTDDDSDQVSILILRSDGNFTAVQVDKITGDQEIVIKPLQGPAAKPLGIAGATVMGDGRIVPIADVMELISLAKGTLARQVSTQWASQIAAPTMEIRESMVLIVDDSITVRELLSLTFKRAGYRVEQARDGQEAWDKLRAGLPCDIVFCDIEMPRMDGLEFLSRVQKDVALSKVPVAMLTSRGSDRHRQIAAQLGASGYFIKPYLEEALLEAAKRMISGEVLQIV